MFLNVNAAPRTDESFRNRLDPRHHTDNVSPLEEIPAIGLVSSFRLDPMHLVGGIVKKILTKKFGPRNVGRLADADVLLFEDILSNLGPHFPKEFNRKPCAFKNQFAVVNFLEEENLAIVPCCWVDEPLMKRTESFWPPAVGWPIKGSRAVQLKRAVRNATEADPNWPLHDVEVLHLYQTYDDAVVGQRLAENNKSLETEAEVNRRSRPINVPQRFRQSSDDETNNTLFGQKRSGTKRPSAATAVQSLDSDDNGLQPPVVNSKILENAQKKKTRDKAKTNIKVVKNAPVNKSSELKRKLQPAATVGSLRKQSRAIVSQAKISVLSAGPSQSPSNQTAIVESSESSSKMPDTASAPEQVTQDVLVTELTSSTKPDSVCESPSKKPSSGGSDSSEQSYVPPSSPLPSISHDLESSNDSGIGDEASKPVDKVIDQPGTSQSDSRKQDRRAVRSGEAAAQKLVSVALLELNAKLDSVLLNQATILR
ncbi:hypothetical protein FOCC_FOCC016501, partial [Frankliniella occidentalis]